MNIHIFHNKTVMLPVALIGGAIFHQWMGYLTFLSPYLIFAMLFITYCKLRPSDFKLTREECLLLGLQFALSGAVYALLFRWDHTVAEGLFICVFVPTATAAPVITSMLGGNISKVATYSLLCNLAVAAVGPIVLAWIGDAPDMTFTESFLRILSQVVPLLLGPLLVAMLLRYAWPKMHSRILGRQQLSFYLWAISLFIIVGSCVSFAITTWKPENTLTMVWLTLGALATCVIQFVIGRRFGRRFGDPVSGGQALMQKNTVLAVWLALAYMNPIASIAPAAYIAWQNIINSWQLMRHESKVEKIQS
ncbi:MAG: transporter [Muribaculaceae bacterium]|nr:transporter [Muribaculaceae bacterium]